MAKTIPVSQGRCTAIVDDDDYERVAQYRWKIGGAGYAIRRHFVDGRRVDMFLHLFIKPAPTGMVIDHINRDRLDNRKDNLRVCTPAENTYNQSKRWTSPHYSVPTSLYKGVSWVVRRNRWRVQVQVAGKCRHIGYYTDETEAARAYDAAARQYHGEFAALNFAE